MEKRGTRSKHIGFGVYERLDLARVGDDSVIITDGNDQKHILERVESESGDTMVGWSFDGRKTDRLEFFDEDGFRRLGVVARTGMKLHEVDNEQRVTRRLCDIVSLSIRLAKEESNA